MDFIYKYNKYKNKYIELMQQNGGAKYLTKNKVNGIYCPKTHPYLCSNNEKAMGLCRKTKKECNITNPFNKHNVIPEQKDTDIIGKKYGYVSDNLGISCYKCKLDYSKNFTNPKDMPNSFKIMTMNIWGLEKEGLIEAVQMRKRLITIVDIIKLNKPDIVCFQEMSNTAYTILLPLMKKYIASEDDFDMKKNIRNRNLEVFAYTKYTPMSIKIFSVGGNLGYDNSIMIIEYSNLIIFNIYLQAGSKFSPGQENNAIHYSRCRREQFEMIYEQLKKYKNKSIIVCGDFNTHLDGKWPETKQLKKLKLKDSFRLLNPNIDGFTEDTNLNLMRWNLKFLEKQFRYDAILYRNLISIKSYMVGTEPFDLNKDETEIFKKYLEKTFTVNEIESKIKYKKNTNILQLWASDHFGVITQFKF